MTNLRLEAALAIQDRKKRLEEKKAAEKERHARERRKNSPAEKAKREERQVSRDESMRLYMASASAEDADDEEPPLHEVILEHVDVHDPKFAKLRARLVITVKRIIAEREYSSTYKFNRNDAGFAREFARAKENSGDAGREQDDHRNRS